ncbi:MAG TPA: DUF222 domain-containing protein, partial [Streptosporangiaceae bacterium]|nr:DUF222 domain-containing protein [Streptosporangiaceae bacterium]
MPRVPDDDHLPADNWPEDSQRTVGGPAEDPSAQRGAQSGEPADDQAVDAQPGPAGGFQVSWASDLATEDVLGAAIRQALHSLGHDLPAWGEPGGDTVPEAACASGPDADPDPLGSDELEAACARTGTVLPVSELGGHARITPGPQLAGWLAGPRASDLDDAGLVNSVTGWRKVTSWAQARELEAVAELARRRGVSPGGGAAGVDAEFAPDEVALALTLTQATAGFWMDLAVSLAGRLPATLSALRAGRIDLQRARLIETYTAVLDDELAAHVEARVLPGAEHRTSGQLRADLQRAVFAVDPAAAERRRKNAERNARIELTGEPEGTASLGGRFLAAADATTAWAHVDALAEALRDAGAPGGIDMLR